jgi:fibronectin type 3 domain-containing protein
MIKKLPLFFIVLVALVTSLCPAQSQHQVSLTWQAGAPDNDPAVGYDVFRMQSGFNFTQINTSVVVATKFVDATPNASTTYQYYVVAVDANGVQSGPSNVVTVTVPADLAFPFNFVGTVGTF